LYSSRTEKHVGPKLSVFVGPKLSALEKKYFTFLPWDGYKTVIICKVQQHYVWIGLLPILIITEKNFSWMLYCFCDGVAPPCYSMV